MLTVDYSKNFTTILFLTTGHMVMFVVKSIVILINGQGNRSNNKDKKDELRAPANASHNLHVKGTLD